VGPNKAPQTLHARVVFLSLTTTTDLPACSPLYCNIRLSVAQLLSSTDFAIRVRTSFWLLTSPTTIVSYWSTILRLNLCNASARRRADLRCNRFAWRRWPRRVAVGIFRMVIVRLIWLNARTVRVRQSPV
jgi:hypothetical protein